MPNSTSHSDQLAHCTVRIECETPQGFSTGSGFFFECLDYGEQSVPVIVTNKHVVAGSINGWFHLTTKGSDGSPRSGAHVRIAVPSVESLWVGHPDPNVDLCVMPINPLIEHAKSLGHEVHFVSLVKSLIPDEGELRDLGALEDILMIGYPNGIWDSVNNQPIFRRGVSATDPKLDYLGKTEFLIDAACFPGSSGSPVFLYNDGTWTSRTMGRVIGGTRIKLLGLLYAGPQHRAEGEIRIVDSPLQQRPIAVSMIPNNLGSVIKSKRLLEMDAPLTEFISRMQSV